MESHHVPAPADRKESGNPGKPLAPRNCSSIPSSILLSPFCLAQACKYSFAEKCRSQVLCSLRGYQ